MSVVIKGNGEREEFHIEKLALSMKNVGADPALAEHVARAIGAEVKEGMTTTEIYRRAYALLRKEERVTAAKYSMRRAILDLGPTGFPFEDFVTSLMRAKGYETKARVIVPGRCIDHEVDVVMTKDGKTIGAELKFHNTPGFKTDVKTALYVKARFEDIDNAGHDKEDEMHIHEGWLITNTKFTSNAIRYSECAGIKLLGWSYPGTGGLVDLIKETGVYPVTVLTTLSKTEKSRLIAEGVALCHEVMQKPEILARVGISGKKADAVVAESTVLCRV